MKEDCPRKWTRRKYWCQMEAGSETERVVWAQNAASAACSYAATNWLETHELGPYVVRTRDVANMQGRYEIALSKCDAILSRGRTGFHLTTRAKKLEAQP